MSIRYMQKNDIMFSVVIPLYNKADTVARTLESVVAQTYKNFEVVIVDDGSTDDGVVVAGRFKGELRLKVVRQNNAGVSVARNTGAQHAKAPYLAFLDADDEWLPGYLEEINQMIEGFPDAEVYGTNYYCVTSRSLICNRAWGKTRKLIDFNDAWVRRCPIHTSSSVVRKDAFTAIGGFVPGHKYYEDAELLFKLSDRGKFCVSSIPLLRYNTDATIRATGEEQPIGKYAHWIYFEEVLSRTEKSTKAIRAIKAEVLQKLTWNFLRNRIDLSQQIVDRYPLMFEASGEIGAWLLDRRNCLAWIVALSRRVMTFINCRIYAKISKR